MIPIQFENHWINPDRIVYIRSNGEKGSIIFVTGGRHIDTNLKIEQVLDKLKGKAP